MLASRIRHGGVDYHTYDVSADGKKFLIVQRVIDNSAPASVVQVLPDHPLPGLTVAVNWIERLKK